MIEFTLNRNKKGKKSRWAKKYPRKMIYVRELRRHIRSNFLVHSISQLVYIRQERLQYM